MGEDWFLPSNLRYSSKSSIEQFLWQELKETFVFPVQHDRSERFFLCENDSAVEGGSTNVGLKHT